MQFSSSLKPEDVPTSYRLYLSSETDRFAMITGNWFGMNPYAFQADTGNLLLMYYEQSRWKISPDSKVPCKDFGPGDSKLTCMVNNEYANTLGCVPTVIEAFWGSKKNIKGPERLHIRL